MRPKKQKGNLNMNISTYESTCTQYIGNSLELHFFPYATIICGEKNRSLVFSYLKK